MRKGGSKNKGSSFERKLCRDLSLWISNGERQDLLWRSSMSGGRSTVALKKGDKLASQAGDISGIDLMGYTFIQKWLIEAKHYNDLNLMGVITQKGNLVKFWERTKQDAIIYSKLPMLVAKQNNYPTMTCVDREGLQHLDVPRSMIRAISPALNLHIILFDDLLTTKCS